MGTTLTGLRTRGSAAVLTVVLGLAITGCGGGDNEPAAESAASPADPTSRGTSPPVDASVSEESSPSVAPSPSSYLPVPAGVTLTDQGAELAVVQPATVAWQPRQDVTGVLDVSVDRLEKTSLAESFVGWKIPPETETATPFFVRATITNRGESDLGARPIPLYAVDATATLIEATSFASEFKPCRNGQFPKAFPTGARVQACLVFFVPDPGQLAAVSFRPTQEFDAITWTGEVLAPKTARGGGAREPTDPAASPSA